jgi:hypothetical protein
VNTAIIESKPQLLLWGNSPARYVILLVAGKAGVGKTTFSKLAQSYLVEKNFMTTILPFANEIKKCAREYFGWDGKKDERGRKLLQQLGTEVGRAYDPDLWVKSFVSSINRGVLHPDFALADDWRFTNEYDYLSKLPEYDVRKILVTSTVRGGLNGDANNHASEHSLPKDLVYYDFIVTNDLTIHDLELDAKAVIDTLLKGVDYDDLD